MRKVLMVLLTAILLLGLMLPVHYATSDASTGPTITWSTKTPLPAPRRLASAVTIGSKIFVLGGETGNCGHTRINEAYDASTNSWVTLAPMSLARSRFAAVTDGNRIYVVGGCPDCWGPQTKTLEIYNIATNSWTYGASMTQMRWHHGAALVGGKIYVMGGGSQDKGALDSMEIYNISTNTWSFGPSLLPGGGGMGKAVAIGSDVYFLNGYGVLQKYNTISGSWSLVSTWPSPRNCIEGTVEVFQGKIYAISTPTYSGNTPIDDIEIDIYDPVANSWTRVQHSTPWASPRMAFATGVVVNNIYVIGGDNDGSSPSIIYDTNEVGSIQAGCTISSPVQKDGNSYSTFGGDVSADNTYPNGAFLSPGWGEGYVDYYISICGRTDWVLVGFYGKDSSLLGGGPDIRLWNWKTNEYDTKAQNVGYSERLYLTAVDPASYVGTNGQLRLRLYAEPSDQSHIKYIEVRWGTAADIARALANTLFTLDYWVELCFGTIEAIEMKYTSFDPIDILGIHFQEDIFNTSYDSFMFFLDMWVIKTKCSPQEYMSAIEMNYNPYTGRNGTLTQIRNYFLSLATAIDEGDETTISNIISEAKPLIDSTKVMIDQAVGILCHVAPENCDVIREALKHEMDGANQFLDGVSDALVIMVKCPVDLSVADPDGWIINKGISDITSASYYETDVDGDGDLDDIVTIPYPKNGDYQITVLPEPDALPTDIYTVEISVRGITTILAQNNPINEIPEMPYLIEVAGTQINAAPIANIGGPYLGAKGTSIAFDSSDSYDPDGIISSYTWDFGDSISGTGASPTHSYDAPGLYNAVLTVTDDEGAQSNDSTLVVIYDPSAGFVTGGGWINSPIGSYIPDATLSGKATFGFVSKYQKGTITPTGVTEFQFKVAALNFHSESYDWLVIAGARAQYKGTGTINGTGDYGFMLTAIDAALTPSTDVDLFRIKIWDKATGIIVYDNQLGAEDTAEPTTAIASGSIVIHK